MIEQLLTPILAALGVAVGAIVVHWVEARSRAGRLERTIEKGKKIAELAQIYVDVISKVPGDRRNAVDAILLNSLQAVKDEFEAERRVADQFQEKVSKKIEYGLSLVWKALFWSWPQNWIERLLFFLFYIFLFIFSIFVVGIMTGKAEWTGANIVRLVFGVGLLIGIRLFALMIERRSQLPS